MQIQEIKQESRTIRKEINDDDKFLKSIHQKIMDQNEIIKHLEKAIEIVLKKKTHHADLDELDAEIEMLNEEIEVE